MRNFLIYTSAGRNANIKQWASSAKRNYDIWVTSYADIPLLNKEYADFYNEHKGSKYQNLHAVYLEHEDHLAKYHAIMALDDDIIISPKRLNLLFESFNKCDLWLLQPAFSRLGKISHDITRRRLGSNLRFTNYVENNCPIFKTNKLLDFLRIYDPKISTAMGLDYWFPYIFGIDEQSKYAISDKYYCINPMDWVKIGGKREFDLLNDKDQKLAQVETILNIIGIKNFKYREYKTEKKTFLEIIAALPSFVLELLFDGLLRLFRVFRKVLHKARTNI